MSKIDFTRTITKATAEANVLAMARASAHTQTIALIEAATQAITGDVPLAEMLSWTTKEQVARELLAAPVGVAPHSAAILQGEADVTGEDLHDLASRIVANADAYRAAVARLAGLRRLTAAAIDAAETNLACEAAVIGLKGHLAAMRG